MPGIYPQSGNIGALLRLIEQERKSAPHAGTPLAEPSAPMRKSVAAPLESPIAPESPGTGRVVSIRPEAVPPTGEAGPLRTIAPTTGKMGQVGGIPGEMGKVVAPRTYIPPSAPSTPTSSTAPSSTSPEPSAPAPSLATQVKPSASVSVNPYEKYFGSAGKYVQENITNIQKEIDKLQNELNKMLQQRQAFASQTSQPSAYEQKKAPSVSERLAGWLQPATNWLSRFF